jgi:hypothetical protein
MIPLRGCIGGSVPIESRNRRGVTLTPVVFLFTKRKKGPVMDIETKILLMLDHIERELIAIGKSSQPVSLLEIWSSWLTRSVSPIRRNLKKCTSAGVLAAYAYLSRTTFGK